MILGRLAVAVVFPHSPKLMCCHLLLDATSAGTNHAVPLGILCVADCGRRGGKGRGGGSHAGSGEEAAAAWGWEIARAKRVLTRDPPPTTKKHEPHPSLIS